MQRQTQLVIALGLIWGISPIAAFAQQNTLANEPSQLREVTVSSTRTERRTDDIPNTVTVITAEKIQETGARDIKDLLKDEIDVSVRASATRFTAAGAATGRAGNEGINIRGLEGNQVLMLVDGVRIPNTFSFGSFATGRGDFLEVDSLKAADVLRGPSSIQFGSDGLAGAVSFRTIDPADMLKKDSKFNGFSRLSYAAVDRSQSATVGMAGRNGAWEGLLLGSYRTGHEVGNMGVNDAQNITRTTPNPVDYKNYYWLGKSFLTIDPNHQVGVTFETQKRTQNTKVYSARAIAPLVASSTLDLDTRDKLERTRASFDHRYKDLQSPWVQEAKTSLYWQNALVNQLAIEDRNTSADRTRDNTYRQNVLGLSTQLESNFAGRFNHKLTYGLDWSHSTFKGVRDGTVPPAGETFPTKPFPDTAYRLMGLFAQNEIEMDKLSVIPGLRFDQYKLSPSAEGYVGGTVATLSDKSLTPRLGVVWRATPAIAPYAQIAKGFRAPTPDQVNNGFTNTASGYQSIGNSALKAEKAYGIELGFRGKQDSLQYSVSGFNNRYSDFISQQIVSGSGTVVDPSIYQYINLARANIRGFDVRSEWQANKYWRLNTGLAYARGNSDTNGVTTPIDTIAPRKLTLGARYQQNDWALRANLTHVNAKESDRVGTVATSTGGTTAQFTSPSSTVLDLGASWKLGRDLSFNANLNNALNTKYWRWSDIRGLADSTTVKDVYTAPGRNMQVSVRYDF